MRGGLLLLGRRRVDDDQDWCRVGSGVGVGREGGGIGNSPAVILLRPLGCHGDVGRGDRGPCPSNRCERKERGKGGGVPNVGEIDLGGVAQRSPWGVLGRREEK